jgi:hypothetical protein
VKGHRKVVKTWEDRKTQKWRLASVMKGRHREQTDISEDRKTQRQREIREGGKTQKSRKTYVRAGRRRQADRHK